MKKNIWLDGMMGLVVGDALGVPVQFLSRSKIRNRAKGPVTDMEAGGVYNMPEGTWSDDSSMAIATMVSISNNGKIDPADIMNNFVAWENDGMYTPFGEAFDEGNTCISAIWKFMRNPDVTQCGLTGEYANGNGALMRILPVCLYGYEKHKKGLMSEKEIVDMIHMIAGLTHNHLRSNICCGTYYFCVKSILEGLKKEADSNAEKATVNDTSLIKLLQNGIDAAKYYYGMDVNNHKELEYINRLFNLYEFKNTKENDIKSTGYVIASIEAAFWCLVNTDSYRDCLVKAVNLGDDTDTVGAIAGGLAGLYYGYTDIPKNWLEVIRRKEWIEDMCLNMA